MTASRRSRPPTRVGGCDKPLRCVLYARVSTQGADQDPETQLAALRPWVAARGWQVVAEERDRVTGDESRRRSDPPGLARALRALEERRADVLAVFAADRLVRSSTGLLSLVGRIQAMGAHVASYQDGGDLDTTSDMGELLVFLRGWYARMELRLTRARIRAGLDRARAEGRRLGPPRRLDIDPTEVRRLREAGIDGDGRVGASWSEVAAVLGTTQSAVRRAVGELVETRPERQRRMT